MHVTDERLLAVVDHLHRTVRVQGKQRAVHLHRKILASSERPADAGEVDPHLVEWQIEARRDLRTVDVQPLSRDVDVDAAFPVRNSEPRLRPEERLVLDAEVVDTAHGDIARGIRIAMTDHHVADDVRSRIVEVTVTARRALGVKRSRLGRALHVSHRLERLVGDDDPLGGAARLLGMLRRNERNRFAEVENSVDREHGLVLKLEPIGLLPRHVGMRENRVHPRHRECLGEVDRSDPRVSVGAPQRVAPQHPGDDQIACIGELALHLRRRVRARNEVPDLAESKHARRGLGHAPAARRTASKIFA